MKAKIFSILLIMLTITITRAQEKPVAEKKTTDTTKKEAVKPPEVDKTKPKPYKEVITEKAVTQRGMITTHKIEDKYFFEIADSLLGRDILVVSRIAKSGADLRMLGIYAGDEIGNLVIRFEKGPNNKLFIRTINFRTYSPDSTATMYQSLKNSTIQPIAASFTIAACSPDNKGSVVEITDYISSDNDIFYFNNPGSKAQMRLSAQQADKSYIVNVRSFTGNVEISTVKTYVLTAIPGIGGPATLELNTSLVLLPKIPMRPRYFDERVGYLTVGYMDFEQNPQGVKEMELVKRWRLEPKPEDVARYKRGELVEPAKPIVFYIDPATPKKWVPYLKAGVNDWAKAFEKAGFKNAIMAKDAPSVKEDPNWSIDDASHSAIVYKASETPNATGPSISDPRSGEIMESHINWYHNVQKLVHDWYMVQAAAIDPRARKMTFSDELMGDLIRFVSSHEVGHTLGLRHNYGSSSTVPTELLRDKKWVEANGHTPSIMDYARFNYVAQPEDHIGPKGIYPRIGDYDKWAIEWGYRYFAGAKNAMEEEDKLKKMTLEAANDKRLWFGTETSSNDPRSQNEDLSDNAMKAGEYGIKNLQVILKNLSEWTRQPNDNYNNFSAMYGQVTGQLGQYLRHVTKNIGGIYETPKTVEQKGVVNQAVPAATQREAMAFLNRQAFTTPTWLLNEDVLNNTQQTGPGVIGSLQKAVLGSLLNDRVFNNLLAEEARSGSAAYTISNLFDDLNSSILKEVKSNQTIDIYRRNLQKMYINMLLALIKPNENDISSIVKGNLRAISAMIKNSTIDDQVSQYHLQDLADRIANGLEPKNTVSEPKKN